MKPEVFNDVVFKLSRFMPLRSESLLVNHNHHNSLHLYDTVHLCISAPLICSVSVATQAERRVNLKRGLDAQVEVQQSACATMTLAHTSGKNDVMQSLHFFCCFSFNQIISNFFKILLYAHILKELGSI